MKYGIFAGAIALWLINPAGVIAAVPFTPGAWENELGSIMTITSVDSSTGQISGNYMTAVAEPGCTAVGQQQPLTGWFSSSSSAITFSVNWLATGCNSVTSWSGRYDSGAQRIETIWTLTGPLGWSNMNLGTNSFWPQGTVPANLKRKP